MRLKLLFCIFLIAENVFVRVQCQSNDGYSYKKRLTFISRITGGEKYGSKEDFEYPWLVGLHDRLSESFFCAGSLISNRHVLSAAHCFHQKGEAKAMDPYHVMAMLGRFNVSDHEEPESLNSLVWRIFIHPEWNFTDWKSNYDADISLVVLEDLIEFSAFIRPVRLPESSDKTEVVGDGTVVGWGHDNKSTKEHEETPSKVKVPAVLFRDCVLGAQKLLAAHSQRTFCAGFLGRSIAPCAGDSGGGFYFEDISSKQSSIEGIVSNSAIQDTPGVCKTDLYTIYTIVANFVPWIKGKVQETEEKVVKDVKFTCEVDIAGGTKCKAEASGDTLQYSVRFELQNFPGDSKLVRKLRLDHGNARVIEGISETFPNLEEFGGGNRIERKTFANMTKLKKLELSRHELITHHYFDDLVNLRELTCWTCRMPKQPKNLFNVLRNLKSLFLVGGANWRILPDETFAKMSKLESLSLWKINLQEISENAFHDLVGLRHLQFDENLITKLPAGLFKNLRNLEEIQSRGNKIEELLRGLFVNNLKLEKIDFYKNKIKRIEADFTLFPKIRIIDLEYNVCVDETFGLSSGTTLQELQELIDTQCSQK